MGAESGSAEERRKQIGNTSRDAARKRARDNESHGESDQRESSVREGQHVSGTVRLNAGNKRRRLNEKKS